MKHAYAIVGAEGTDSGKFLKLIQKKSKRGLPCCIWCARVVSPRERRHARRLNRPAYFCTGACKQAMAMAVVKDVCNPIEWIEPESPRAERQRGDSIGSLKVGWIVRRLGKTYEVTETPHHLGKGIVRIELKHLAGRRKDELETFELHYDCRFVRVSGEAEGASP